MLRRISYMILSLSCLCHISPLVRPKTKDIQFRMLQIIDNEIEGENSEFIPADMDDIETTDKQSPDKVFSDGPDSDSVAKVGKSTNQSTTQLYQRTGDKKIDRTKHRCEICNVLTEQLPHHMKSHKWSKESSSAVVALTGQRKKYTRTSNAKLKDYHRKRWCPVESCKFVSDRIEKHLKNKHKELDENQHKMMLKLVQPFMQLPSVPTCSPVKTLLQRNIIVKETCSSVGDVITEELPSVNIAIDFHATNMEQTAAMFL